jgi:imidazolonepropionase-like amidohydrolase
VAYGEVKVFKNFTLIDGTGKAAVPASAMVVTNGRITWIGSASGLKAPASAETIDLGGKFMMPGVVNTHTHIGNTVDLDQDKKYYTAENIEKNLKIFAEYGITAALSMGTDQDIIFKIRAAQRASGRPTVARVFTAGQGLVFKGGYGGLAGVNQQFSDASEIPAAVDEQAAKHPDAIKFWMDDELGHYPKMPYTMSKAIIDQAHKHHLKTLAHIFYLADAIELSNEGLDGFVHTVRDKPVDQTLIDAMKKHNTWQIAGTLSREASMFAYGSMPAFIDDPFFVRAASPNAIKTLKDPAHQKQVASDPNYSKYPGFYAMAKTNYKKEADSGVKYAMGTDTGPPGRFPGYGEHWEMEAMQEAGLTPMEVIVASTRSGAEFLGAKDIGTIEKGKWADLLILDANPLDDVHNMRKIASVWIGGNQVH